MHRRSLHSTVYLLALVASLALAACGGEDHMNMDPSKDSGAPQ